MLFYFQKLKDPPAAFSDYQVGPPYIASIVGHQYKTVTGNCCMKRKYYIRVLPYSWHRKSVWLSNETVRLVKPME